MPIAEDGSYSEENLEMTKAISAWKLFNKNVVSEVNELKNHIDKTLDMKFAADLPVFIIHHEIRSGIGRRQEPGDFFQDPVDRFSVQ